MFVMIHFHYGSRMTDFYHSIMAAYESMLGIQFLAGSLTLVSLFITWYRSRDSLVGAVLSVSVTAETCTDRSAWASSSNQSLL